MNWVYTIVGYSVTFAVVIFYTGWLMFRGRGLSKKVPVENRRYLD